MHQMRLVLQALSRFVVEERQGATKMEAEKQELTWGSGLPVQVTRPTSHTTQVVCLIVEARKTGRSEYAIHPTAKSNATSAETSTLDSLFQNDLNHLNLYKTFIDRS